MVHSERLGVILLAQPHHGIRPPHDPHELMLRRWLSEWPGEARLHALLGLHLWSLGRKKQARAAVEEALRLDPTSAYAHYVTSIFTYGAVRSWRLRHDFEVAIFQAKEAIRFDAGDAAYHAWLAELLIIRAQMQFGRRLILEALQAADEGLRLDPVLAQCHVLRGRALARLRRHHEAAAAFIKARDLAPESPEVAREHGRFLAFRNDLQGAETCLREASEREPNSLRTRRILRTIRTVRRIRAPFESVASYLGLRRRIGSPSNSGEKVL